MSDLRLEINATFQEDGKSTIETLGGAIMITPPVGEDYWTARVKVSEEQAILAFPKFGTIGIGFAIEEDWNTNLPYTSDAEDIFNHISHNKGNGSITDEDCIEAIRMLQDAISDRVEEE